MPHSTHHHHDKENETHEIKHSTFISSADFSSSIGIKKQGWMVKEGEKWKTWKRRFFRINNSLEEPSIFFLSYFASQVSLPLF